MENRVLPLKFNVGRRFANQREDVTLVQMALATAKQRPGSNPLYSGRIDGQFGPKTEAATRAFQTTQNEQQNGEICVNAPGHRKLEEVVKRELQTKPKPPKAHLTFNGTRLCWVGAPHNGKCWNGVSGVKGFQNKEFQGAKDQGPIPEGRWRVRQDRYQKFDDIPLRKQLEALFGRGTWPGGTDSWGRNRIWIEPLPGTQTLGRRDFSIHGGADPGSAGCVDLTHQMPEFTKHFRDYGADMDLVIRY